MADTIIKDQFKITVQRITTLEYPSQTNILIEKRHYTDTEINESHNWMSQRDAKDYMKELHGRKDIVASKEDKIEVYEQVVDATEFNLKKVIGAVNDPK